MSRYGKKAWFIGAIVIILIAVGWGEFQKRTDDTHSGMSIIPEQHKDIPLFKGLEPTDHDYVMNGDHWKAVYDFYTRELPKHGWYVEYKHTDSGDSKSFDTSWRKKGQDWELTISGSYFKTTNQTEIIFDKLPIYHSTTWITTDPASICIYQNLTDENCAEVTDKKQIEGIIRLINTGIDWDKKLQKRKKTSLIVVGELKVKVLYEGDKEIYLQSEKGIKLMKPEPEFFQMTELTP